MDWNCTSHPVGQSAPHHHNKVQCKVKLQPKAAQKYGHTREPPASPAWPAGSPAVWHRHWPAAAPRPPPPPAGQPLWGFRSRNCTRPFEGMAAYLQDTRLPARMFHDVCLCVCELTSPGGAGVENWLPKSAKICSVRNMLNMILNFSGTGPLLIVPRPLPGKASRPFWSHCGHSGLSHFDHSEQFWGICALLPYECVGRAYAQQALTTVACGMRQ